MSVSRKVLLQVADNMNRKEFDNLSLMEQMRIRKSYEKYRIKKKKEKRNFVVFERYLEWMA